MGPTEVANALQGLADAGGGLGVDDRQQGGVMGLQGGPDLLKAEGFAPGALDSDDLGSVAASHIG